jgi:hypothetical protein
LQILVEVRMAESARIHAITERTRALLRSLQVTTDEKEKERERECVCVCVCVERLWFLRIVGQLGEDGLEPAPHKSPRRPAALPRDAPPSLPRSSALLSDLSAQPAMAMVDHVLQLRQVQSRIPLGKQPTSPHHTADFAPGRTWMRCERRWRRSPAPTDSKRPPLWSSDVCWL